MTAALPTGASDALELLLRATLLIGAAWAAAAALRAAGASAAARHMAWLLGIAALLALPLVWWLAPALNLPVLPQAASASAAALAPTFLAPAALAGPAASDLPLPGGWIGLLALVYAAGAGILLLRIAVARRVLARVWREAEGEAGRDWDDLLSTLSLDMHLPRPVELRIANRPLMPMTWGTLAPRILLPADALSWPPERRRHVLLHELAHIARRDSLSRSVASLACALYWFHPGAWLAARAMRIEQEHAADDRVLVAGGSARAYARSLLHLATPAEAWPSPAFAAAMAGAVQLERRLTSIISPVRRDRPTILFFATSASVAALTILVAATAIPVSPSSVPADSLRPGLAGIEPLAYAPDRSARAEAPRDSAGAPPEAAVPDPARSPAPPRSALGSQSSASARDPVAMVAASQSQVPQAQPAERIEQAAPAYASAGPVTPTIPARSAPLILPPAAAALEPRAAERSPFRLASNTVSAPSAASINVPRALVDGVPARWNRVVSRGRFGLYTSAAQPALP